MRLDDVCVYETDLRHPTNAPKCTTRCVTLFGHPQCIWKDEMGAAR